MYTNGNFEAHMAALLFMGTLGLTVVLGVATLVLIRKRRSWARYSILAIVVLLAGYSLLVGFFSWASFDRTVKRGDQKFFCAIDCHIGYSVQNVERVKTIGDATPQGELVVVTLRSHFDERTIAPWRGNGALKPDPPTLELVDSQGRRFPVSASGQQAWEKGNANLHSLSDPLRPGESFETTWVFEVPADSQALRLYAGWYGFPSYVLIGDEASPGHRKTYFAL
jgi:hypothetical protein